MNENPVQYAELAAMELRPGGISIPLDPEEFRPGESFASFYGRKAEANQRKADEEKKARLEAEERERKTADKLQKAEDDKHRLAEIISRMVAGRRQKGHTDEDIADDLGITLEELLKRYPAKS